MPHVDVLVVNELLDAFSSRALPLLRATEVKRTPVTTGTTAITLDMPYVPEGALSAEPTFQLTPDGVRVQSINWHYPDTDDPDDPPVQCWHTEPNTPCDWDICRQPERLAVGDYGTDPAVHQPVDPV